MDSKLYYKTEEITIDEEIKGLKRLLAMMESILSKRNHCDWDLHKRAQANYKARLEVLYKQQAEEENQRDDDERFRSDVETRMYDL